MRSYAGNQGTQVSNATLKADMDANDSSTLDEDTVLAYVNALKKIFVVEDLPAWNPNDSLDKMTLRHYNQITRWVI